jgi:hypothetical protein
MNRMKIPALAGTLLACISAATAVHAESPEDLFRSLPNLFPLLDPSGFVETYNINNTSMDLTGAFFQSLGTNGRSCSSCHRPAEAWSISASEVRLRFLLTQGLDPISAPTMAPTAITTSIRPLWNDDALPIASYSAAG